MIKFERASAFYSNVSIACTFFRSIKFFLRFFLHLQVLKDPKVFFVFKSRFSEDIYSTDLCTFERDFETKNRKNKRNIFVKILQGSQKFINYFSSSIDSPITTIGTSPSTPPHQHHLVSCSQTPRAPQRSPQATTDVTVLPFL